MTTKIRLALAGAAVAFGCAGVAEAINLSVPAINGDTSRTQLGDGTGVIVGILDSGVDDTHPALTGNDSQGNPRLVAEGNFVPTEPANTGDDVHGHGTWVSSVVLGNDPNGNFLGMATDARFVNARVLNNNNGFNTGSWVENGVGFAISQGADVLNLSLNFFANASNGNQELDEMLDWAAQTQGISVAVCAGNISQAQNNDPRVRSPGSAYHGVSVGLTDFDFDQVASGSSIAFTQDGRMKPDVVAPGTSITMANDDHETQADYTSASGCSFATPHVAGLMAQMIDAGRTNQLSTSPLVIKSTLMNAASKDVLDKQGNPWDGASTRRPLDTHSGAGQIDGAATAIQYLAGEHGEGMVPAIGWDLGEVDPLDSVEYEIDTTLVNDSMLTATLTWFRDVTRIDRGAQGLDAADIFTSEELNDLDLLLLEDGVPVAVSDSLVDNVEHIYHQVSPQKTYTLRVEGVDVDLDGRQFSLAWSALAVPEPGAAGLALIAALALTRRRGALRRAA
ncbi:MAG: S8 family peptidase [Planctomycetota bacterium]